MARWTTGRVVDPVGQAWYTNAAIQISLMVRTAFKLPLRQTNGLMALDPHVDGRDDINT